MSRRSTTRRGLAAVLAVVAFATSCGDDGDGATSGDTSVTNAPAAEAGCTQERVGGSITMGVFSEAQGLDPAGAPGAGATGGAERAAIFDTLVRYNPESGEYEPHVAESVTPNDDYTQWTITLRPGVTFGNGDPLTAAAVKASFERHAAQEARSSVKRTFAGSTITTPDDRTVVVTIQEPWVDFPFVLAREGGMVTNPAIVAKDPAGFSKNPAGAGVGPYELVRYTPGDSIVLQAKDDYWGGPVCVEELRFVTYAGSDATLEALDVDTIQVGFLGSPRAVARSEEKAIPGFDNIVHYAEGILLNNGIRGSKAPTTDPRLRRAIALAIDPRQINDRVWNGEGLPTTAIVHPDSRLTPEVDGPKYDPQEAAKLVEQVKADGWDGRLRLLCNNAPDRAAAGVVVDTLLTSVGIDVELDTSVDIPGLINKVLVNADFDAACWGQGAFEGGLWFTFNTFHSKSPAQQTGYSSPAMDAALDSLARAATDDDEVAALTEMQKVWNETNPSVIYAASNYRIAHSEKVQGLKMNVSAIVMFDDAYLDN